jgi:hypothetical protein
MTDRIKREIEGLLDEPADVQATDGLRSRLAATFSEGLEAAPSTGADMADIASMAAFIDGQLKGDERDKYVADLVRQPGLRADLESAAALVDAVSNSSLKAPANLLAQANARFAPAPAPKQEALGWDLSSALLSIFQPRRRLAIALVAALAVIVAVPAGLILRDQSGGGAQPELSGISEPVKEVPPAQKDKACDEKSKDKAKTETSKSATDRSRSDPNAPADPCDPLTPKREGATSK